MEAKDKAGSSGNRAKARTKTAKPAKAARASRAKTSKTTKTTKTTKRQRRASVVTPSTPEPTASPPPLIAAIDVGSRALRMSVGEVLADGTTRRLETLQAPVAIGYDTFVRGRIRALTTEAVVRTLSDFVNVVGAYGIKPPEIWTVATTAVRDARNREVFLERVEQQTGLEVHVLDAIEETRLAYQLVRHLLGERFGSGTNMLLALGAGGTQIVVQTDGEIELAETRKLGLMRLIQTHGLPEHDVSDSVRAFLRKAIGSIGRVHDLSRVGEVIVINNDVYRVVAEVGKPTPIDGGLELTSGAVDKVVALVDASSNDELVDRYNVDHATVESARMALAELDVFRELAHNAKKVVLPASSMLDSLLLDRRNALEGGADAPVASRQSEAAAWAVGRRYRIDIDHAAKVRELALQLFDGIRTHSTLADRSRTLLAVAAILHDIGIFVSTTNHEVHGGYLIRNSQIMGLSRSEVERVALLVRFHRRAMPSMGHPELRNLRSAQRVEVLKLTSLLRVADSLDADDRQLIESVTVEMTPEAMHFRAQTRVGDREGFAAIRRSFKEKADLCEELFGVKARLTEVLAT
ncbi:MAG: HD domain-containing protein [Myxococcales bacterium]|nr:HD domain-containing protein [Myxococcales bacterium]